MKKIFLFVGLMCLTSFLSAGSFWTLNYNYSGLGNSALLSVDKLSYLSGDIGYIFEPGLTAALRYDHLGIEDNEVDGQNVRVIAAIPSIGLGYVAKCMNEKILWWSEIRPGYAVSARYRKGITDYKSSGFAFALATAVYYHFNGVFYAGLEIGYRYLLTAPVGLNEKLNLSGMFFGLSFKHSYDFPKKI